MTVEQEMVALRAGTHQMAVDDFGNQYLAPAEALDRWAWLRSTVDLQTNVYGYDLDHLIDKTVEVNALQYYMTWNLLAAIIEMAEMSVEMHWAPWSTDKPFVNRERVRDEGVDVGHFLGNILTAAGVTDKEYEAAYRAKQAKNRRRAESGTYSKVKGGLGEGSDAE